MPVQLSQKPPIEIVLPVLVHSCRIQPKVVEYENLMREERYVEIKRMKKVKDFGTPTKIGEEFVIAEREVIDSIYYLRLPKTCRCRKYVSYYQADKWVAEGKAMRTLKLLKNGLVKDEDRIWTEVVRSKVPRVDLITKADVERSVLGSNVRQQTHKFNSLSKRFEVCLEGKTLKEWIELNEEEAKYERRIKKQYKEYIEGCHDVLMQSRLELMAPWRPDPFEGRCLFSFSKDMLTVGGHAKKS